MADIYIHYGRDPTAMTQELMERADVQSRLRPDMSVVIKPNLVVARPAKGGATTHPEVVEGIIRYLQGRGVRRITVAEGAWVGDSTRRAWKACGYDRLAGEYGVRLLDTKEDAVVARTAQGLDLRLCRTVVQADFLINVPVLKGHCQTDMTCCLKNMKGCIPDSEKRRYHTLGLHKPIAALNTLLRPDLHIIDSICGDLTFEEGGNPVESNRILLGWDSLLLDSYCAGLMGFDPEEIGYLRLAREFGLGGFAGPQIQVEELGGESRPKTPPPSSSLVRGLQAYIQEDGACSACYAALVSALYRSGHHPRQAVKIGQGFRGKSCTGAGVGNCTAGCSNHLAGCPPKAVDILSWLDSVY